MKSAAIIWLSAIVLTSCSSRSKNKPAAASLVTTDSLLGSHWMFINVEVSGTDQKKNALMESFVGPLKDKIELCALSFYPNNSLQADEGNATLTTGAWALTADTLKLSHAFGENKEVPFTITKFQRDSLGIENLFESSKDNLRISYTLKRIHIPDSTLNIFDPAQNTWRIKPSQPESEAAMRLRLKQMLAYYSAYFATLAKNKIPFFNREKILCPLLYYDGAIELRPVEEEDNWGDLFYDEADAHKAHTMLGKVFSAYDTYPDLGKQFVQEYIIALKQLSEKL